MAGRDFSGASRACQAVFETELKFQIPKERRAVLARAVATASARTVRLRARYFDTPDRRLAAAGLALRLRLEGRHWVQTLKGRGDGLMQRVEHEVAVPGAMRTPPGLDVSRHAGTPAGEALAKALGDEGAAQLQVLFETDVKRVLRLMRHEGAQIEVALDIGHLRAGQAQAPLSEIEFELKRGPAAGLIALAARWAERHGLWLDVRTKAERGDRLARGVEVDKPTGSQAPVLHSRQSPDVALRAIVGACLAQILPNASDVAAGVGTPDHLHQTRVGVRRLRSALREFGDWTAELNSSWEPRLSALFDVLGAARDRDVLSAALLPALRSAGAPMAELPSATGAAGAAGAALREASGLWLSLIDFCNASEPAPSADDEAEPLRERIRPCLKRLHRQVTGDADRFETLDDALRHRTRKRLKRLRYCVEFVASLYGEKAVKRYLKALRPAQEALGHYNDVIVAEHAFRERLAEDPRAWFALGWLAGQRMQLLREATQALMVLSKASRFWTD